MLTLLLLPVRLTWFLLKMLLRVLLVLAIVVGLATAALADLTGSDSTGGNAGPLLPVGGGSGPVVSGPTTQPGGDGQFSSSLLNGGCGSVGTNVLGCPQPAPTYTTIYRLCGDSVSGSWAGPEPTEQAITTAARRDLGTTNTAFKNGDHSLAACSASLRLTFNAPTVGPGLFVLTTVGRQVTCSWHSWSTGQIEFVGCGKPVSLPHTYKFSQWCGGSNSHAWDTTHSFTANDCGGTTAGLWSCGTGTVTWNLPAIDTGRAQTQTVGTNGTITTVYSGDRVAGRYGKTGGETLTFSAPQITGLTGATIDHTRLVYLSGPQKGNADRGATFVTTNPGLGAIQHGTVTTWQMSYWNQAPVPHTFQAEWTGTGDLTYTTTMPTSIDLATGNVTFAPTTVTAPTTFTCTTTVNVLVNGERVIN